MFMKKRIQSFKFAFRGIMSLIASQPNAWIHLTATVLVISMGFFLKLENWEWCTLVVAITQVWLAEALNTAFEFLADSVTTDFHPLIKKAKDIAAGAVLLTAIGAVILGALVFLPHLW